MIKTNLVMPIAVLLGVGVLTACSGPDPAGPEAAATAFSQAVAASDGSNACALLSPQLASALAESAGTPCARAVLQQDLPAPTAIRKAAVYGKQAWVITQTDTVFMSEFRTGWKVIGAGCRAQGEKPYDCSVSEG